ncbi:alpha/beta fold hydrolase [Roseomonas sp. HF4]|uniref:alpha/beta fold hydrolase n=1 Tax=Roseomonas sp. HF4 TaxID=2562313 RepID=UPI0010C02BAC|nr:alpha/beta fold hydrolase [Roseomonas sp. HF4]
MAAPQRVTVSARDGLRLSALEWAGPAGRTPLLVLSGISRTALDAETVVARHAGRRRIVALDYAGHGESGRAADPARYRPDLLVRDVLDAMAALHLHRVAVVGTSFGGLVAMAMSAMRPAALAAVALNDIGPAIAPMGREKVLDLIGSDHAFRDFAAASAWYRERHPPMPLLDEAGWEAFTRRTYAEGPDGLWHPRWDTRIGEQVVGASAGRAPDLWAMFRGLDRLPLMLVWGDASTLLTPPTVAEMRRLRPDMAVVALPGTGHSPTLGEAPAADALEAFLEAVP